jgi:hypothetical protein
VSLTDAIAKLLQEKFVELREEGQRPVYLWTTQAGRRRGRQLRGATIVAELSFHREFRLAAGTGLHAVKILFVA